MSTVTDKLAASALSRPKYTCTIPDSEREWDTDPKTAVLQSYTLVQDLDASKVGLGPAYAVELLTRCVVELDGTEVDQGRPFLDNISPRVRVLLMAAMNQITLPSEKGRADFLSSLKAVK